MRRMALMLLALAGCGLGTANLDEPSICKTVRNLAVPALPPGSTGKLSIPLTLDVRPELDSLGVKSGRAELTGVTLTPVDGVSNLDFITSVNLALANGPTLVQLQSATPLELPGTGADVMSAALAGPLSMELTVAGALPSTVWHVDVQACLAVNATVGR